MGAWGTGPFESDGALDWASAFHDEGVGALTRALETARDSDYLEVDDAMAALAAAEVVAAINGHPGALPDDVSEAVHSSKLEPVPLRTTLARLALKAVENGSELQELFDEDGRNDEWHGVVEDLRRRLLAAPRKLARRKPVKERAVARRLAARGRQPKPRH